MGTLVVSVIVGFVFTAGVLLIVFRSRKEQRFAYSLIIAHSIMVVAMGVFVGMGSGDAQRQLSWIVFDYLDFVVAPVFFLLRGQFTILKHSDVFWPTMYFLTAGGLQYYLIGFLFDRISRKFRKPSSPNLPA